MGFRPEPKQYRLTFTDDPELAGLEVTVGSVSVGEYNQMLRQSLVDGLTAETLDANDELLKLFASRLVSWNLEDQQGAAVPATLDGVLSQDRGLIAKVITAWQVALITVPKTSKTGSPDGQTTGGPEDLGLAEASSPGS